MWYKFSEEKKNKIFFQIIKLMTNLAEKWVNSLEVYFSCDFVKKLNFID